MNLLLLKQIGLLGALIGLGMGVISLIPFIGHFLFVLYFLLLSAVIIVYLKKINILGKITIKEGGIIGAVLGFCSIIAFSIVFVPLAALIQFIFSFENILLDIVKYAFTSVSFFFVLIFFMVFLALLCALMNGFSGAVTAYIYEVLEEYKKGQEVSFERNDFEIK
ncbi:hypothetical protein IKJ53_00345 [bacterium]|nr:hypothetical protein [bacterium]